MHSKAARFWGVLFGYRRFSSFFRAGVSLVAIGVLSACTSTVDSLGHDNAASQPETGPATSLRPLVGPDNYDNAFHDILNPTPTNDEIKSKVENAYQQLFHGYADTQAIYFVQGDDEAYIKDLYHDDIRTEGIGIGMLISVELDHQEEFDKLWTYAKREKRISSGGGSGYFASSCDNMNGVMSCVDPYGLQMFAMALIFAHDRWAASASGSIDYESDALDVLDVMLNKEKENGGILEGYTNTFDPETLLVFDTPTVKSASLTRPSILMPAFYDLWAQATGNPFFASAAQSARAFLNGIYDPTTGLVPLRAYFDGTSVPGFDAFESEAYRVFPNLVVDEIWTSSNYWTKPLNLAISFFASQGIDKYGSAYELDGTIVPGSTDHEIALVLVNGLAASKVTSPAVSDQVRRQFVQAVWDQPTPTKDYRYYQGIMQLFALCVLSGQMRVW